MMVVHAAPKTQPGGVHGALFSDWYQSEVTPELVNNDPIPKAAKLISKKSKILSPITPVFCFYRIAKALVQVTKKDTDVPPNFFKDLLKTNHNRLSIGDFPVLLRTI